MKDPIQPGDIFVKTWGMEKVIMMLPRRPNSAKQWYLRLSTGTVESAWWEDRNGVGNPRKPWRYVGTVPEEFMHILMPVEVA